MKYGIYDYIPLGFIGLYNKRKCSKRTNNTPYQSQYQYQAATSSIVCFSRLHDQVQLAVLVHHYRYEYAVTVLSLRFIGNAHLWAAFRKKKNYVANVPMTVITATPNPSRSEKHSIGIFLVKVLLVTISWKKHFALVLTPIRRCHKFNIVLSNFSPCRRTPSATTSHQFQQREGL
jgi:hypothetical protein